MAIESDQVTVGSEITIIVPNDKDGAYLQIKNMGGATVYLGPSDVTVDDGYELEEDEYFYIVLGAEEELYGICDNNDATLVCYLIAQNE